MAVENNLNPEVTVDDLDIISGFGGSFSGEPEVTVDDLDIISAFNSAPYTPPPVSTEGPPEVSYGEAFSRGIDQPLENIGVTLEVLNSPEAASWFKNLGNV